MNNLSCHTMQLLYTLTYHLVFIKHPNTIKIFGHNGCILHKALLSGLKQKQAITRDNHKEFRLPKPHGTVRWG